MFLKAFVDETLGNSSYLIASEETGQAAVIDPQRDVDKYLHVAEGLGLRLAYALDTHLHNDFVSGVYELAAQTGLRVGASAEAEVAFEHVPLRDGDTVSLGDVTIGVIATPGHTPEHISFSVAERHPVTTAIFTGGALIVGGAARTDLLGHELSVPLARQLYHTLHDRLLTLPEAVKVYPTHGAGSFCIAPVSAERVTTIGHERSSNPLAQQQTEDEFVARSLAGLPSYPFYFKAMRSINQRGPVILGGLPRLKALSSSEVAAQMAQGTAVLDVRPLRLMVEGSILGAYCIPLNAPLVTWAGWLIPFGTPLILVSRDARDLEQAVRQLIRIGFDDLRGYLDGQPSTWIAADLPVVPIKVISVAELHERWQDRADFINLDVRQKSEWAAGHIPGVTHIENGDLPYTNLLLPLDRSIVVYCQHGSRAVAGLSVLQQRGYRDLTLVKGGFAAWSEAGFEVEREQQS